MTVRAYSRSSIQNFKNSLKIGVYEIVQFFGLKPARGDGHQLKSKFSPTAFVDTDRWTDAVLNFLERYFITTPSGFDNFRSGALAGFGLVGEA